MKTAITGHNISLIGQSMDKTIIVTKPDISMEGLGKADLLDNSGTNLYLQDLTLQNALDYYAAGSAGRAAVGHLLQFEQQAAGLLGELRHPRYR